MNKNYKNIALSILFGGLSFSSFTSTMVILLLKAEISSPVLLTLAILSQKFIKIFSETPLGMVADIYGVKRLFLLSPFMMLLTIPLLYIGTIPSLVLCMILQGLSTSVKNGKIEGCVYNSLKKERRTDLFPKMMSAYFVVSDLLIGVASYAGGVLYHKFGQNGAFIATATSAVLSAVVVIFIEDKEFRVAAKPKTKKFLLDSVRFFSGKTTLIIASFILTLYNFFGWQFGQVGKLLLSDNGVSTHSIAKFYGLVHILMSMGSVASFFVGSKVSVPASMVLWLVQIVAMTVCNALPMKVNLLGDYFPALAIPLLIYPIFYPIIQIPVIKYMEDKIPMSKRMTVSSFASLIAIFTNITLNFGVSLFVKSLGGYSAALQPILVLISLLGLLQFFWFIKDLRSSPHRKRAKRHPVGAQKS